MSLECGDLLIGNSMKISLVGLSAAGTAINDATVTAQVKNSSGTVISGGSPITLNATGSDGNYDGVTDASMSLTENANYTIEVTAVKAGVGTGFWRFVRVAKYRDAQNCGC